MDEENVSPEEKLLKAVEKNRRAESDSVSVQAPDSGTNPVTRFWESLQRTAAPFFGRLKFLPKLQFASPLGLPHGLARIDLHYFNYVLAGIVCLVFLAGLSSFFIPIAQERRALSESISAIAQGVQAPNVPLNGLDYYKKMAQSRNLFQPYVPPANAPEPVSANMISNPAGKTLKLTAVAVTGQGQEAIIEDSNLKQSYFVRTGDKIEDWEVESIEWDQVILKRGGEKWKIE